jgi:single-strand DNA-binding protein
MSNEQVVTTIGRLTEAPELRFTPNGAAVVNFTLATNARTFDRTANEWKDEPATFWRCSAWRELAENIAESLTKGDAVIAQGVIKSRSYEKDGQKRTVMEQEVTSIGPDLRWATARPQRVNRSSTGAPQQAGNFGAPAPQPAPWGQQPPAPPAPGGNQWGQASNDPWGASA